ncbi:uncharacterized protein [Periplaneta americana]|uniref:uncharacterized protein n=1 Tax=Periplaneta americana TaxID=6978 RepID=UPI0037E8030C
MAESDQKEDSFPSWMNNSFFEMALRSGENNSNITVTSTDVQRATAPGENFMSEIYRVTVQMVRGDESEKKSLIVKITPIGKYTTQFVNESDMFAREARMLKDVMPAMQRLLDEVLPRKCKPFAAKHVYSCLDPPTPVIIVEDLKEQGFQMSHLSANLDLNHSLLVIRTIARFHAASVVLKEKEPELLEPFMDGKVLDKLYNQIGDVVASAIMSLANQAEKWPEFEDRFIHKIRNIGRNFPENIVKLRKRAEKEFNVLAHNDLWVTNIMFRYSDTAHNILDLRFVDFQLCYWMSPAIDLLYFLHSSTATELLDKHDVLIEDYYTTLGETLALLGYKDLHPKREDFMQQIESRGAFATIIAVTIRSVLLLDRSKLQDFEKRLKEEHRENLCSDIYKQHLRKVLPILEKKGWI